MECYNRASTGLAGLDETIDGLRLGDNVVWQVDTIGDYRSIVEPFVARARADGRPVIYIRHGTHEPVLSDLTGVTVYDVDAAPGFETFATTVHHLIAREGFGPSYVFDSLTDLLHQWHSDLAVMNFFKVTCPFLYDLDTVAYFPLVRNEHTPGTIAGIRETTQVLLDLHHIGDRMYVHPLKVWGRHSPSMFFPHRIDGDAVTSITSSADAARLFASLSRRLDPPDHWRVIVNDGWAALDGGDPAAQDAARDLLSSVLIGREGRMVELSRRYLTLADLLGIAEREIGTGYVGGKSVGMLIARAILDHDPAGRFAEHLEPHDSFYLGSDLFYTYIVANGWWRTWTQQKTPEGYFTAGAELRTRLAQGRFPPVVREQFLRMLEHFGQSPIIVRSSSLLEDNFGNAFAGKYESVFCANQGTPEERHRAFEDAVRTVYASAMSEDALTYRLHRGLVDRDEQMAILVQRVSGDHHGDAFFPHAAGVANSSNLYVWAPDVDMDAGMLRLVLGLGTRAVERTVGDYARIVTLDDPTRARLRDPDELSRYSQRHVDVLSLSDNALVTVPLDEVRDRALGADPSLFFSPDTAILARLRELRRPPPTPPPVVLDFHGLLSATSFPGIMRLLLETISAAYTYPVDIEFTVNLDAAGDPKVDVVQCRPLQTRGLGRAVAMPTLDDPDDCLFSTTGNFMGGNVRLPLDWVLIVRPEPYLRLTQQDRHAVARLVGAVNAALRDGRVMLIGPGRWGTSTPSLGVPVRFTEICHAAVLAEVTYAAGEFRPELSYGSHFFQDLVESGIFYAAVFDGDPGVVFHPERVLDRPNEVAAVVPGGADLAGVVHLARCERLILSSDIGTQRLVCR